MRISLLLILLSCSVILSAQKRITLFFAGDLMQHQAQIDSARNGEIYDYSDCFSAVKPLGLESRYRHCQSRSYPRWETLSRVPGFLGTRRIPVCHKRVRFRHSAHGQQPLSRPGTERIRPYLIDARFALHSPHRYLP